MVIMMTEKEATSSTAMPHPHHLSPLSIDHCMRCGRRQGHDSPSDVDAFDTSPQDFVVLVSTMTMEGERSGRSSGLIGTIDCVGGA